MQYYQRLKDVREDKDLKQGDVAEILKTTQQQYSRWESGAFQMPMENYKILARYYNVSLDYLAGLIETPKALY
ncbi:MAG: helix-turn-helix transcriptional regulator [Ruminococcaceae bacterium]|nr:helix-turn-helix transcriptional regulator [Oscillospiraceae bacterium]